MAKFIAFGSLVVVGIIIADIVTHGSDFAQASTGVVNIEKPAIAGLLGVAP
jgi:hypothetical protein